MAIFSGSTSRSNAAKDPKLPLSRLKICINQACSTVKASSHTTEETAKASFSSSRVKVNTIKMCLKIAIA
jgi:hypothetical protein